ncbi:hypothetical protein V1517DRAFT_329001 [Lipomyces orientalis]|uniref:Uncharacterized protein n=1 Tax=Lipomyces orientalis TaxID=1233043 RepID=A0ACC3THI2_9ASCO
MDTKYDLNMEFLDSPSTILSSIPAIIKQQAPRFLNYKNGLRSRSLTVQEVISALTTYDDELPKANEGWERMQEILVGAWAIANGAELKNSVPRARVRTKKRKSEAFHRFQEFLAMAERYTGNQLKVLRTDNGGEYASGATGYHISMALLGCLRFVHADRSGRYETASISDTMAKVDVELAYVTLIDGNPETVVTVLQEYPAMQAEVRRKLMAGRDAVSNRL